jgi:hypothetical protein
MRSALVRRVTLCRGGGLKLRTSRLSPSVRCPASVWVHGRFLCASSRLARHSVSATGAGVAGRDNTRAEQPDDLAIQLNETVSHRTTPLGTKSECAQVGKGRHQGLGKVSFLAANVSNAPLLSLYCKQ